MHPMLELIRTRRAIRRYRKEQVEEALLEQVLEAGLYAPSAGNTQLSRIVVCQDQELNEKLGRLSRWMMFKGKSPKSLGLSVSQEQPSILDDETIMSAFYGAPTVLTIFTVNHLYAREDAAMIAENIMLAAHALGLASCYIGRTEEVFATETGMALRKAWGIPEDMAAVGNVLLGYREGPEPRAKPRRPGRVIRV